MKQVLPAWWQLPLGGMPLQPDPGASADQQVRCNSARFPNPLGIGTWRIDDVSQIAQTRHEVDRKADPGTNPSVDHPWVQVILSVLQRVVLGRSCPETHQRSVAEQKVDPAARDPTACDPWPY